jgi:hypothetical protein
LRLRGAGEMQPETPDDRLPLCMYSVDTVRVAPKGSSSVKNKGPSQAQPFKLGIAHLYGVQGCAGSSLRVGCVLGSLDRQEMKTTSEPKKKVSATLTWMPAV